MTYVLPSRSQPARQCDRTSYYMMNHNYAQISLEYKLQKCENILFTYAIWFDMKQTYKPSLTCPNSLII